MKRSPIEEMSWFSELSHANPFLPERFDLERRILGSAYAEDEKVWHLLPGDLQRPNISRLQEEARILLEATRGMVEKAGPDHEVRQLHLDLVLFILYHDIHENFEQAQARVGERESQLRRAWKIFTLGVDDCLDPTWSEVSDPSWRAHTFACFYQLRRAFHYIYSHVTGGGEVSARLRAAIWKSVFTHDLRRYRDGLHDRMSDFPTLISGPTGTGKELVARAIACSAYIPFDPVRQKFVDEVDACFLPLNLSAMPVNLVESELFGHVRGAFTGATADRVGWLETCKPWGCIFLDEIGDLSPAIQVKLLRVLQTRKFQRVGDLGERSFRGRVLAATHRDLNAEMESGRFRSDFYYRLCADRVETPALIEILRQAPGELANMVELLCRRIAGASAWERLSREVQRWIEKRLPEHSWPGNFRELEQCVRSILIRGEYHPPETGTRQEDDRWLEGVRNLSLSADVLLSGYCARVWKQVGSFDEAAKRLKLDRRTVRSRVRACEVP